MDWDTLLTRVDCQTPFFASFILDKYADIKETDPEGAKQIETRFFTPEFLISVLKGDHTPLQFTMVQHVPPACFESVWKDLDAYYAHTHSVGGRRNARQILKAVAPEAYFKTVEKNSRQTLDRKPESFENFFWLNDYELLPDNLKQAFFDRSVTIFKKNQTSLTQSPRYEELVRTCLLTALQLEHPDRSCWQRLT